MKIIALLALLGPLASAQSLEVVHISDTHVMQIEGIHPALLPLRMANLLSAPQLEKFLDDRRANPPAFFIHTGDILGSLPL